MRCWKQWEFTKCPRSTIESTSNEGQCLKSLEISKEAFYVFRRFKSEYSCKWNEFKTVMYLPLSKHFPDAWSLPQNTATSLSFRISRIYLVWLRPLFQGSLSPSHTLSSCNARCLLYPDKNTRKTPCFDSTLGKRTYKAFEWEAKFVWVMRGVLSEETIFRICTQRYFTKLHLTHEIFRILPVLSQFLWNFYIHFLGLPWEIFFGVTTDDLLHL